MRDRHSDFEAGDKRNGRRLRRARKREERSTAILGILREAAKHQRSKQPQPFYSIRDVSRQFHISPATAARIFARLKSEGLLRAIWGSKTLIEPTQLNKQLQIRGVVALPASLPFFCAARDYRSFFLSMRDVLWRLGFATRLLFYEGDEAEEPAFVELLRRHKVDVVIWFLPNPKIKETAACLADHGIRMITVTDSGTTFGEHRYRLSRETALKEALVDWQKSGISSVTVVGNPDCDAIRPLGIIEECLREVKIPHTTMNMGPKSSQGCPRESSRANCGIIFSSPELAVKFRRKYPAHFAKVLHESRVMLMEQVTGLRATETLNGAVDVIEFDWEEIANRIGSDLVNAARSRTDKPVILEAKWFCETWIDCQIV